uniref:Uncharacterized protein n=1 Tax=Micrurus corallinus TaxID=54390 RepID=A0A2D4GWN0_MICCO
MGGVCVAGLHGLRAPHASCGASLPSGPPKLLSPGSFIPRTGLLPEGRYSFLEELCGRWLSCLDIFGPLVSGASSDCPRERGAAQASNQRSSPILSPRAPC